ncbi:MAG: hypothetical protein Q4D19_08720 [Lautropia sp.]|nr:hypothetical protein [Lautropia sp.]
MLSSCIALSLSLAACGQAGTDETPLSTSLATDAIPYVEEVAAEEEAFIVATEPVLPDAPVQANAVAVLASADQAGQLQDGAQLPATDATLGNDLKHPRPTPWMPAGLPANHWNTLAPVTGENTVPASASQQVAANTSSAGSTPAASRPDTASSSTGAGNSSASGTSQSSSNAPRLVPAGRGYSLNSPEMARLYGPGLFTQTALANTIVGSPRSMEAMVSNRFLSMVGGQLASVRLYWQAGSGYSAGTGGTIRLSVYPDDGSSEHLPNLNAKPLATGTYRPNLAPNDKRSLFTLIPMEHSGQALETNKLYHLVLQNVDPRPQENYISSNNATTYPRTGRPNRWLNTQDWATLLAQRYHGTKIPFKWRNLTEAGTTGNHFSPILQLNMKDGRSQGVGDMEGGHVDPKLIYTMTSSKPVRERFIPSSAKVISGISIATDASVAGALKWRFLRGETEIASGQIVAPQASYQTVRVKSGVTAAALQWQDIALPVGKEIRMEAGQTYHLELQPEGNSEWKIGDHRNGSSYGFSWPAAFTESQALHRHNGNWISVYHWDYNRASNGSNWPVVLHLAP